MMRVVLFLLAAVALVGLGAGGALLMAPERIAIVVGVDPGAEREAPPPPPRDRTDEVLSEIQSLRDGLVTLGVALDVAATEREHLQRGAAVIATRLERIRTTIEALQTVEDEPDPPAPVVLVPIPAPPQPKPVVAKRQTLAELLAKKKSVGPLDRATRWKLMPKHGRVGFDGRSTIHNFTARSDRVAGAVTLHWNELGTAASGDLRLDIASLDSGSEGRDEAIREHLGEGGHNGVSCRVLSLQPKGAARDGVRTATAKLRFTIHGRAHEMETPVKLTFTPERLLRIQGEAKLKMSDFGIHPAAKLGVIKVDDAVTVWWDLYAEPQRANR